MAKSGIVVLTIVTLALSSCGVERPLAPSQSHVANDIALEAALVRRVDDSMLPRDSKQCERWEYDAANLAVDFARMREVASEDWGRLCYTYACSYTGSATYQTLKYQIEVNAGGWIILSSPERQSDRFFVSDEESTSFLDSCDCCE